MTELESVSPKVKRENSNPLLTKDHFDATLYLYRYRSFDFLLEYVVESVIESGHAVSLFISASDLEGDFCVFLLRMTGLLFH